MRQCVSVCSWRDAAWMWPCELSVSLSLERLASDDCEWGRDACSLSVEEMPNTEQNQSRPGLLPSREGEGADVRAATWSGARRRDRSGVVCG